MVGSPSLKSLLAASSRSGSAGEMDPPSPSVCLIFANQSGRLCTLREVAEDDPGGRFANLLNSVEGVAEDGSSIDCWVHLHFAGAAGRIHSSDVSLLCMACGLEER